MERCQLRDISEGVLVDSVDEVVNQQRVRAITVVFGGGKVDEGQQQLLWLRIHSFGYCAQLRLVAGSKEVAAIYAEETADAMVISA